MMRFTHLIALVIGIIGIAFGAYGAFSGQPVNEYIYTLLAGIALLAISFVNHRKSRAAEDQEIPRN